MTHTPVRERLLATTFAAMLATSLLADTALGQAVDVPLSNVTVQQATAGLLNGTSEANLINDTFTYNPNLLYTAPLSLDAANIPDTQPFNGSVFFQIRDDPASGGEIVSLDVSLTAGQTLDWIDIWGRSDAASGENGRYQQLTLEFFDGPGASGNSLGVSGIFNPADQIAGLEGSAYGRFDVSSVLSASDQELVQSFTIHHPNLPSPNNSLLLAEVRAASGAPINPNPVLVVDRVSGSVEFTLGDSDLTISSYTLDSGGGALNAANWDSVTSGTVNSALDSDPWVELSAAVTNGTNLSEGELPGGDGGVLLTASSVVDLGEIWSKSPSEDLTLTLIDTDGNILTPAVVYEGNGGVAFAVGDLDFDNDVDLDDYAAFRSGFGGVFASLSGGETYPMGDLDGDLDVDVADFRAFEAAYDAVNSLSLSLVLTGVPEPTGGCLAVLGVSLLALRGRRMGSALVRAGALCLSLAFCGAASAQTFTVIDAPDDPFADVSESAAFNSGFVAANMFTESVTAADIDTTNYGNPEFATRGQGPVQVYVDNNESITTNWIAYAQRNAAADFVGSIEVWFSDTDFGGTLPLTEPDAVVDLSDRLTGNLLQSFPLGETLTGQYTAMNFIRAPSGTANIGGREFRFLQGPDQFILEVDRSTGDMTIKNDAGLAQALDIDAYQIASAGGSLSAGGFTGLAGQSGFPAASVDDAGDGWELGEGSGSDLLAEAFLLGGSSVGIGAELSLGAGYDLGVDARDLTFTYSLEDGISIPGAVVYVNEPFLLGDADDDGDVDGDDLIAVQTQFGDVGAIPLLGDADNDGDVDGDDLIAVQTEFGNVLSVAIPEPSSLWLLGTVGILAGRRRSRRSAATAAPRAPVVGARLTRAAVALVALCVASVSIASTPDRLYLLGDNSTSASTGDIDENGAANIGNVIGSQSGTFLDGFTQDHAGDTADFDSFAPLSPEGDPVYADVSSRPGSGAVGAEFDGNDYLWTPLGFGNPSNADDLYVDTISYTGLINHYMQGWVYPTSTGSAGDRQTIIRDTDQFRMHIDTNAVGQAFWGHHYANTTQTTETAVVLNQWTHIAQYSNGDNGFMWVNGVIAGTIGGFYQPNGGGPEGDVLGATSLSLGADVTGASADPSNFFTGQLDDFDVRVTGDNSTQPAGADYGALNLDEDNAFIAELVASGQLVPGDVNGDGFVNGDGTGAPASDDVSFFVDNYLQQQVINFVVAGDLTSRTTIGDLNYSGTTNLLDWLILVENHEDTALAASLDIGALIAGNTVPEPSAALLAASAIGLLASRRRG